MLSESDSENNNSFESLIEKMRKAKNKKGIEILNTYINNIRTLSNEIKKKENLLLYYNLKLNKIKDEYDEINNEIIEEENDLIEKYISAVEKEEYYLSPSNLEIKDLSERARQKKSNFTKIKDEYDYAKLYLNKDEEDLDESINNLTEKEKNIYTILKEYLINDKSLNKIKDDYDLLNGNENYNEIIRNNMEFIRDTKNKLRKKKKEINEIRNEIKNNYEKKTRKNMNHLNYNDNLNSLKNNFNNKNYTSYDDTISHNDDLNKTNITIQNNLIPNLNKTFYLRVNKSIYGNDMTINSTNRLSKNSKKNNSCSLFLKTDSSEKFNTKDKHLCKRLLKNYCNKYIDKNKEFLFDLKIKERKNQSMPKNLYHQRKQRREEKNNFIYINGNKYKQSLIGKATNTVNGVY